MNIIFTVCNRKSLPNALALGNSVMHYPGNIFYLCWVDTVPVLALPDGIKLISVQDLDIPGWDQMIARYYDFELLPACRPWFVKYLFNLRPDGNKFGFFAPTTLIFEPIDKVIAENSDMLLTRNISEPLRKSPVLDDKRILNIGMFHSGSWILKRSKETLDFVNWWAVRTIDRAKFDLCNGMCLDQLWLNFALVRITNAQQISNSGWHYGLHSILNKKLKHQNGQYTVDGNPLISVDFAGLGLYDPIWSDYVDLLPKSKEFQKLYMEYQKSLNPFRTFLPTDVKPGYGLVPVIKKNRIFRKKLSDKLRSITSFIDQF